MKNKLTDKFSEILKKFKENKKFQVIFFISILLLIIIFYFALKPSEKSKQDNTIKITTSSYSENLENKLEKALLSIDGVEKVNVLITLETGFEYVYATEQQTKSTLNGTQTTTSLVLVSGEPVIVKEIYPIIKGVVIVCNNAKNIKTRLDILSVAQTVLEISNDKITIID